MPELHLTSIKSESQKLESEIQIGEFPGGSVVKTCAFTAVDPGLIPGWEIPQAMQCGKKKFRLHYEK